MTVHIFLNIQNSPTIIMSQHNTHKSLVVLYSTVYCILYTYLTPANCRTSCSTLDNLLSQLVVTPPPQYATQNFVALEQFSTELSHELRRVSVTLSSRYVAHNGLLVLVGWLCV